MENQALYCCYSWILWPTPKLKALKEVLWKLKQTARFMTSMTNYTTIKRSKQRLCRENGVLHPNYFQVLVFITRSNLVLLRSSYAWIFLRGNSVELHRSQEINFYIYLLTIKVVGNGKWKYGILQEIAKHGKTSFLKIILWNGNSFLKKS